MFGLFGDLERDPIFGAHTRLMNQMMGGMLGDMDTAFGFPGQQRQQPQQGQMSMGMTPFGGLFGGPMFPQMPSMMMGMNNFGPPNGGMGFSSTQVMSMQSGPNGQPLVYQASSTTRQAPDGMKETIKTVQDSRSGLKKMQVGRHLGAQGHVMEKEQNIYTGQTEENEELLNMDFHEKDRFEREWQQRNGRRRVTTVEPEAVPAITFAEDHERPQSHRRPSHHHHGGHYHEHPHHQHHHHQHGSSRAGSSRSVTHHSNVTIEELSDSEETTVRESEEPEVVYIPASSPGSRKHKEKRLGKKAVATKKSKKY